MRARAVERGEIRKIDPTIGQFNFFPAYPLTTDYRAQTHMQQDSLSLSLSAVDISSVEKERESRVDRVS